MLQASPQGGTTSLPQYLQKRKPTGDTPGEAQTQPTMGQPTQPGQPTGAPMHDPNIGLPKPIVPPSPLPPTPLGSPFPTSPGGFMAGPGGAIAGILGSGMLSKPTAMASWGSSGGTQGSIGGSMPGASTPPVAPIPHPQAPGIGGTAPGGTGNVATPAPAPAPKPVGTPTPQPPAPGIPAAPPPPAPTPALPPPSVTPAAQPVKPGQTGQGKPGGPIGMDHLKGVLEQILGGTVGGQGRYGDSLIKSMEDQFTRNNTDLRKQEETGAIGDAAKRGVYYGTPLTNSMGDIRERFIGRQADSQNALLKQIADAKQEDQNNAIGNVFKYGEGENANQTTQSNILTALANIGMAGGPSLSGAYGDFNSLPQPGQSDMSDVYKLLGSLFGGQ